MNKNIKKWIKALRSGKYRQGRYALRNSNNQYCCLGVVCDLWSKETKESWGVLNPDGNYTIKNEDQVLPIEVYKWLGFKEDNPSVDILDKDRWEQRRTLTEWNDIDKLSFKEIADLIETNLSEKKGA